jgi:4-amino-4-deoxychorismate lyase
VESPLCPPGLRLIETVLWDGATFPRRAGHMARLQASAATLGFRHDADSVARALDSAAPPGAPARIRLTLGPAGDAEATAAPVPPAKPEWRLVLSDIRLASTDPLLRHKTTRRDAYDRARAALPRDADEALLLNERGEVCEGTITTLFFDAGQGLMTPPLTCGCLAGVLRAELLAQGTCHEAILHAEDLPRARLWVGNALRGLISARLA